MDPRLKTTAIGVGVAGVASISNHLATTASETFHRVFPRKSSSTIHPLIQHLDGIVPETYLTKADSGLKEATFFADRLTSKINSHLQTFEPYQIVVLSFIAAYILFAVLRSLRRAHRTWQDKGAKQLVSGFILDLPIVRGFVHKQQDQVVEKLRHSLASSTDGKNSKESLSIIPQKGLSAAVIKERLQRRATEDVNFSSTNKVSGTVYLTGQEHMALLNDVYAAFSITNPMHSDVFPSVRRMEAEVVSMTAALLGGGPLGDPNVCGVMTSGGTESILTAMKASRDYAAAVRGIKEPEMIMADSGHAAYFKAAEYFNIRLVRVPVGKDYRLSAAAVKKKINKNTILVIASAPGFPHGVVDHIDDISKVTHKRGILLHVDCCLGGFVLPFIRQLNPNHTIPAFDFAVPGVTSISVDTHKFGMAHKGTSVVLYRSAALRRKQYTSITDWTGGLYISPGFAGSRSGALIATAWAAMAHLGQEGYLQAVEGMMTLATAFRNGVAKIDGLEIVGEPEMTVIAFKAVDPRRLDIYRVNDLLSKKGWHLNALQRPAALHVCFTPAHQPDTAKLLLKDLKEAVEAVKKEPAGSGGEGMAPMYGMAATVPDRRIVANFLVAYQDIMLES